MTPPPARRLTPLAGISAQRRHPTPSPKARITRQARGAAPSFRTGNYTCVGEFPRSWAAGSCPIGIKGLRPARGATEPAPPALQPAFPPHAETLRAEPHGPRRDPRRRPAPPRRAAVPAPGGRRPARSRCDPAPGIPRAGRGAGGCPSRDSPLTESALPAGAPVVTELRCRCLQTLQGIHFKNIQSVKVTPPGPHCSQTEVV